MLGYRGPDLKWTQQNGKLTIQIPEAAKASGQYAWVVKIDTRG